MVHVLGINLPDSYVMKVSVDEQCIGRHSNNSRTVCPDENLRRWTTDCTPALCSSASTRQMQSQGSFPLPNNLSGIFLIIPRDGPATPKAPSRRPRLYTSTSRSFHARVASTVQ